jgi:hypothetical protein
MEMFVWYQIFSEIDTKLWYVIIAFIFGILSFTIYLWSIIKGQTQPHPFSWFIWFTTQMIATAGAYAGGGGYGLAYGVFYCCAILSIFIYTSVKFGLRGVSREDWICLIICIIAIAFWLIFDSPHTGVLIATGVDAYGYEPSWRKAFHKPWSESVWGWVLSVPNIIFTTLAMNEYNFLTLTYPSVMVTCTLILILICMIRRKASN